MTAAIRTEHLTKIFSNSTVAVSDLDMVVPEGSVFGLLGPNGAGKTTTLRLLLGLQRPSAGTAEIFGVRCGPNAVAARRLIGYLPTNPNFPPTLKPIEYLDLVGRLHGLPRQVRRPRVASLIRAVDLLDASSQPIKTFSTGMTTRLGIAASLMGDPPLLIWDEPTAGLDPTARRFTLDLIRELGRKRTVVLATHILNDIDQLCDHVGVIHDGRMIFCGTMRDMKRQMRSDTFHVEFDADDAQVAAFAQQINGAIDGLTVCPDRYRLTARLSNPDCRSRAVGELLGAASAAGLALRSIHTAQDSTEDAYLRLLQEDISYGFQRFRINEHPGRATLAARGAHDS